MRLNRLMSAQGLGSGLGEQVVREVAGEGAGLSWRWRGPTGWFLGAVGGWVRRWRRDHPEFAEAEVGAEQSAGSRRLRAWLREARSWEVGSWAEAASFLRAEGPGRRPVRAASTAVDRRLPDHHRCAAA